MKELLFVLVTLILIYISRASLADVRSHGFYRFFAWEIILVLALRNLDIWFRNPFTWHQIVSWVLLSASLFLVVHAVTLFRRSGPPDRGRDLEPLLELEKTAKLITKGAYGYIRHPMYSSLLLLAWGIAAKNPTFSNGLLALGATLFLIVTARIEESENIRYLGDDYREYMKRTKKFLPFLY